MLLLGRQGGAAAFFVAVIALPRLVSHLTFTRFMWAYVIELFVSSILSFGLERVVAAAARTKEGRDTGALTSALAVRALTLPLTAAGVIAGLWIVHVRVSWLALAGIVAWTGAVQFQGVLFAALRAMGKVGVEPVAVAAVRIVQAIALIVAAEAGVSLSALVLVVALPETTLAAMLWRAVAGAVRPRSTRTLPWALATRYAAIEMFGFAYLRADAFVIGNLLGPGPGATYALAYRVVDGLTATITPFLLHLFPAATRAAGQPEGLIRLRRSLLPKAPSIAAVASLMTMSLAVEAARIVPRLGTARAALQVLVVTMPLYAFNALELHLRSAEGRNRDPAILGVSVLVLNVVLNVALVRQYGLVSAAWVLVACELLQAAWLARTLVGGGVLGRTEVAVGASTVLLLGLTAALLVRSELALALPSAAGCLVLCIWPWAGRLCPRLRQSVLHTKLLEPGN